MIRNRIDRLSSLLDYILHHIFSFFDIKFSVQTNILSRRWISVWKYVYVIHFGERSLGTNWERHVDSFLSLRSDRSSISRVTMEVWVPQLMISRWIDLLDKIIKYAASHGVRELFIRSPYGTWASVSGSVCASYQSLKVLELNQLNITKTDVELWSCLKLLESLTLANCRLPFGDGAHDALPNFPRLETLKLDRCFSLRTEFKARVLIVTGPELLNFEMVSSGFDYLEIDAPKLQSFGLMTDSPIIMLLDVSKSNLPSLSRANIDLVEHVHSALDTSSERDSKRKQHIERCVDLFKVLHNIEVLNLQVANLELLIQLGEPQFSP